MVDKGEEIGEGRNELREERLTEPVTSEETEWGEGEARKIY